MRDRSIDKVDQTMSEIQEQTQLANEVSEAISSSSYAGVELDDVRHSLYLRMIARLTTTVIPLLLCFLGTHRTSSSRNLRSSNRRSSTTGSWPTTYPCTIQAALTEWRTVRISLRFARPRPGPLCSSI